MLLCFLDAQPNTTDFSRMELWMEFTDGVTFQDPSNSEEPRRLVIEKGSFTPDAGGDQRS